MSVNENRGFDSGGWLAVACTGGKLKAQAAEEDGQEQKERAECQVGHVGSSQQTAHFPKATQGKPGSEPDIKQISVCFTPVDRRGNPPHGDMLGKQEVVPHEWEGNTSRSDAQRQWSCCMKRLWVSHNMLQVLHCSVFVLFFCDDISPCELLNLQLIFSR